MLRKAQARVRAEGLTNVETLAVMDAKNLAFTDACFDAVVAQYVITAVPDPEATLDDFVRVLKPGGELILVNHIGAESGPRHVFELAFAPLARRLGWRPEFPWERLVKWAARHGGVSLEERRPMPPMGHFSLIRYRKCVKTVPSELPRHVGRFHRMRMKTHYIGHLGAAAFGHGACTSSGIARDPAGADRAARGHAADQLRADGAARVGHRHHEGRRDRRPVQRGSGRQAREIRRHAVPAGRRRSGNPRADARWRNKMPVIPPPGSPGGDPSVRPK